MHGYIKTSEEVARIASSIYACARNAGEIAVLYRLLHDMRMNKVWKEFMKEKQGMPGVYLHPAVGGAVSPGGPEYAQHRACGKVLSGVFTAVCNRGQLQVSKWPEEEEYREKVWAPAAECRRVADELAANGLVDPAADGGAAATLRLALVKEARARQNSCGDADPRRSARDHQGSRRPDGSRRFNRNFGEAERIVWRSFVWNCRDPCRGRTGPEGQQASGPVGVWAAQVKCK